MNAPPVCFWCDELADRRRPLVEHCGGLFHSRCAKAFDRGRRGHSPSVIASVVALTWPMLISLALMLVACVVGPDGRRTLSPNARAAGAAVAGDIIACGAPLALSAIVGALVGEAPTTDDYLRAGECHVRRAANRLGVLEASRLNTQADAAERELIEHGQAVVEAVRIHERHDGQLVIDVDGELARGCEATARERLGGGEAVRP